MEYKTLRERIDEEGRRMDRLLDEEKDKIYRETGRENDRLAEARAHIRGARTNDGYDN